MTSDFRSLDARELELSVLCSLRRSLTASCDDNKSLKHALDVARAARIAIDRLGSESLCIELLAALQENDCEDSSTQYRNIRRVFNSCVKEWEATQNVKLNSDKVAYFLTGTFEKSPAQAPESTSISRGICISMTSWTVTLLGLAALIAYLTFAFTRSANLAINHLEYQPETSIGLPIISLCPGVLSGTPLFAQGLKNAPLSPSLPLLTVARVEVKSRNLKSSISRVVYPSSVTDLSETVDCAQQGFNTDALNGILSPLITQKCVSCFRLSNLEKIIDLREDEVLEVDVAVNGLLAWCMFADSSVSTQRISLSFNSTLAAHTEALLESDFLRNNSFVGTSNDTKAEAINLAASSFLATNEKALRTDFFCNALFVAGFWYPVNPARESAADVGYDWKDGYWRRRHEDSRRYWNLKAAVSEMDGTSARLSGRFWHVFAADQASFEGESLSSYVGSAALNSNARFLFRRQNTTSSRIEVSAPVSAVSHELTSHEGQSLYVHTKLEFGFDRHLTEQVKTVRGSYTPIMYAIDVASAIALFVGATVHSVIVAPISFIVTSRLARRHAVITSRN